MYIVYIPCKNLNEARKIGRYLVQKKLAVCVNCIRSIYSIYKWKENIEESKEALLIVKTSNTKVKNVIDQITKLHSYNLPEIIGWKIDISTPEVSNWIKSELEE
ncbi:hypothetical protein A2960_03545 [Candidatus Gottesmanbacteria bacterium RIFCSPLOWO2_01_FULL_39_12b]|uniref:Divalent cation transporter n=1 Tax=Candidatus Gottesmanbacteria bacterium RIFCSPLOWO2_01_FULL_39_12b TaxID=1798388 RepID=A0A1F6AQ17_9BACT|nr:MAG: hypothetical protein A2960_03545 [Candidatus Gottesmanbacteria bacterium RIFCSPLOWO2_01_FULL_39_12b]